MADDESTPVLPGDIVQITDQQERWFQALLVVEEVRRWGVQGHALVPGPNGVQRAYYRVAHDRYQLVGTAALVEADVARARKTAEETAREIAAERQS
jgi:hypothetical protein